MAIPPPIPPLTIPLPQRDRKPVETQPCAICGAPAVIVAAEAETGHRMRICADHLPPEARAVYDRLRARGWRAPAPRTPARFDAHPHGQRVGRRITIDIDPEGIDPDGTDPGGIDRGEGD
jgi:hypothetical protein